MPRLIAKSSTPLPRRKACGACSQAKVRCDQNKTCSRCRARQIECVYARAPSPAFDHRTSARGSLRTPYDRNILPKRYPSVEDVATHTTLDPGSGIDSAANGYASTSTQLDSSTSATVTASSPAEDIVCTIDSSAIQNRWLNAFLPDPEQRPKVPPPAINAFVARILKAYTGAAIRHGSLPPFVHPQQLPTSKSTALDICLKLLGLCSGSGQRGFDTAYPVQLIENEMTNLYASLPTLAPVELLAAFHSYLLYTITLYLHLFVPSSSLRTHILNLQHLASATCAHGTMCTAELESTRPRWTSWLHVEAKRRSLYVMYLLDNLLCVGDGTPVYVALELRGLPAPSGKALWCAESEDTWRRAYNQHLADWNDTGLRLDELWKPAPDMAASELEGRRSKVDQWLEGADEYCTMLYAVTSCTHGD